MTTGGNPTSDIAIVMMTLEHSAAVLGTIPEPRIQTSTIAVMMSVGQNAIATSASAP
jgi:hypothetical protein